MKKTVKVFSDGIVGKTWTGYWGALSAGPICIYDSSKGKREDSLFDLCDRYLIRHGGDFMNPMLMGLSIEKRELQFEQISKNTVRTTTTVTQSDPYMTPDLQRVVACDSFEPQPTLLELHQHVQLRWSGEDEDLPALENCLTEELTKLWERVQEYRAPGYDVDASDDDFIINWVEWAKWKGEGWYTPRAVNVHWDRQTGWMNPVKLLTGKDLVQWVMRQDQVGSMEFTFEGPRFKVIFSGHDTMAGTIIFSPTPAWVVTE